MRMIVRVFKMKENATDAQCQALSDKLDYHGKLLCDNERRKEIVAQFDDELDLLAFQVAIGAVTVSVVEPAPPLAGKE
jgi:hypothetical protein